MNEYIKYEVGEKHVFQKLVTERDAAHHYGAKVLHNLLATPSLIAMVIEASVQFMDHRLAEGYITVGKGVSVTHTKPTYVGETVTIDIKIEEIYKDKQGIRLAFVAYDEIGVVATGQHERSIVNRIGFMDKTNERLERLGM